MYMCKTAHTSMHTHKHTDMLTKTCLHTSMHTQMYIHILTYTNILTHTQTYTYRRTYILTYTLKHKHKHTHTYTLINMQIEMSSVWVHLVVISGTTVLALAPRWWRRIMLHTCIQPVCQRISSHYYVDLQCSIVITLWSAHMKCTCMYIHLAQE